MSPEENEFRLFSSRNKALLKWANENPEAAKELQEEISKFLDAFAETAARMTKTDVRWGIKLIKEYAPLGRKIAEKYFGHFDNKDERSDKHKEIFLFLGDQMTAIVQNFGG